MSWLRRAVGAVAGTLARWAGSPVRGTYDAAATTPENAKHWAKADDLSASAANSADVRRKLRMRSRYARANNGYIGGLVRRIANHIVGPYGPRLSLQTPDETWNRRAEALWQSWCRRVKFPRLLRCLTQAYVGDGEGFGLLTTDPETGHEVQLALRLYEADQVATPSLARIDAEHVDGIELSPAGRPTWYHLLRQHPGDGGLWATDYARVPAASMVHWFRLDRPGQYRGVPHVTAGLPLAEQLRRYTLAVLGAAEVAANITAVLTSDRDPAGEDDAEMQEYQTIPIERGTFMQLPAKHGLSQLKAEQPTTTYEMFVRQLLKEIGSGTDTPFNVVACDSSPYNFSSARLDHLLFRLAVLCERADCESEVLDRIFDAWMQEAILIIGPPPAGVDAADVPHEWYWSGFPAIDPRNEAAADTERLNNGTTNLRELLAEWGQDWREFLVQRGRELELARRLGVPYPQPQGGAQAPAPPDGQPQPQDQQRGAPA